MRQTTGQAEKVTGSVDWASLLLLFMMGCAVGLFIITMKFIRPGEAFSTPKNAPIIESTTTSRSEKKVRQPAANSKKKTSTSGAYSRSVKSDDSGGIRTAVQPSEAKQKASTVNVKTESAPVFQSNSVKSALVKSLKKGDEVRVVLEIIDAQGAWTLIRGAGLSGYVQSEMLERQTPEKQAQR